MHLSSLDETSQCRAFLVNEVIGREVWDTERKEGADIGEPSLLGLTWQAVDEVEAEVIDSLTAERFDSREDLLCRVTAVEERLSAWKLCTPILTRLMGSLLRA